MRILLTNDDGFDNPGLWALWSELGAKHQVTVVAPRTEQSGISHAFTLHQPLQTEHIKLSNARHGWRVTGTPSDCVKIGIVQILKDKPDVVIAGINAGSNEGVSHFYSGTVAAAREAALWGIPGIAISVSVVDQEQYEYAARFLTQHLKTMVSVNQEQLVLLNINLPHCSPRSIKGVRVTRQSCVMFEDKYLQRKDPRGKDYYWVYGYKPSNQFSKDSDDKAVLDGYIAVTPLLIDVGNDKARELLAKKLDGKAIQKGV